MKNTIYNLSGKIKVKIDVYKEYGTDNFVRTDEIMAKNLNKYVEEVVTNNCDNINDSVKTILEDVFNKRMSKTHRWKSNGFIYIFYK